METTPDLQASRSLQRVPITAFAYPLLIMGSFFVLGSLTFLPQAYSLQKHGIRTEGVVTSESYGRGGWNYTISYTDSQGQAITLYNQSGSLFNDDYLTPAYKIGSSVPVIYDPSDPNNNANIDTPGSGLGIVGLVLVLMGVAGIVVGVFLKLHKNWNSISVSIPTDLSR